MDVVEKMLAMGKVDKDDVLYDLGCGDGRIVITAARRFGTRGVGIDLVPERIVESTANAEAAGVENLVDFRLEDATRADFSDATVVTMYLLTESNELLRPHLERQLRIGVFVVSHNYPIELWEDKLMDYISFRAEDGKEHSIYAYRR
ncbi:MAG: class I SAM-dependent methyltransferase [Candidatus Aminicenantes bacterium]|nr:class I SAM-dependent methyltransferase [Candidatus Aminicenantes bacterium]